MRGRSRAVFALLTAFFAFLFVLPSFGTQTEIDAARSEANSIEEEKKELEQTLKELEGLKSDTAAYVEKLDRKLVELNAELAQLEGEISVKENEVEAAAKALAKARQEEDSQRSKMKLRIQFLYENGQSNYLELLFGSKSLSQFLNRAEYAQIIAEYDRDMLRRYAASRQEVDDRRGRLNRERGELVELRNSTQGKRDSVEKLLSDKNAELTNYGNRIKSAQNEVGQLQRDMEEQERKIKEIEKELRRKEEEERKAAEASGGQYNTISIGNISFIWPCPSSNRITSGFGGRSSPMEGASSNHQGMDIGASTGSDIVAAASGTVTIATYSYSAGNYIMINHGGGVSTVYMHCSQLLAEAGRQVSQGQVIAKVGSTGYSTGPHLHFGVRISGSYVNPANYVSP